MAETLKPDWVSGFTDGEGCFGVYVYRRSADRSVDRRPMVSAEFSIQLREDDREVLEAIRIFFGCGNVGNNSRQKMRNEGHSNARDQVHLKISALEDLVSKVITHFDAFPLRSKKARDYVHWREAVMLLAGRKSLPLGKAKATERGAILKQVLGLVSKIREGRNPGLRRSKRDMSLVPTRSW